MSPRLATICCLFWTSTALGQATDTTPKDTTSLPDVVVKSTRRTTVAFKTPLAVTRIGELGKFGTRGFDLSELIGRIPGVFAQSRSGGTDIRISIRGYGARGAGDRSNAGTSRGVRVLLDGFPETEPDGRTAFDAVDLSAAKSVEVIRSNASSLWGNAAGGVVSISTTPDVATNSVESEVAFGGFGFQRYVVSGNSALGEGTISATFSRTEFDGWRVNSSGDRWLMNAGLQTRIGRTDLGVYLYGTDNFYRIPGPLTAAQVEDDPTQANATYLIRFERRHNRVGRLGTTIEHDFGGKSGAIGGMFYLSPKFLQRSERGTFRDFTRYHVGGNAVYRNSIAIKGEPRLHLLGGADLAHQDGAVLFYSLTSTGERGTELRDNKREGSSNLGAFAQGDIDLGDRLTLTLGARYDRITYHAESFIDAQLSGSRTFDHVSPKIGVNYRPSLTRSFYANVGGGVEAPAGNETDPIGTFGDDTVYAINPLLEPIRSTTYEVGTKHILFHSTGPITLIHYDLAGYWTEVRDDIIPYRGGRFYFTAGAVRRQGVEVGLSVESRYGVGVAGSLTYAHHRYTEYLVDSVHYGQPGAFADYSGHQLVGVPTWVYNGSLSYMLPSRRLRAQIGLEGISRYFADDANTVVVKSYLIANATVGLLEPIRWSKFAFRGAVSLNNIFDRKYVGSAFLNPDVVDGVPVVYEPGLPRSLTVSVAVSAW